MNDRWPPTNDASVSGSIVVAALVHEAGPSVPNRRWAGRLVVLIVVLLVMGPILYTGLPHEIASWYAAAAFEKRLNGDFDGAFELLERGLTWDPEDASIYQLRADWKLARQDYPGCVEDCERALELEPKNPAALTVRSQAFQHLGRHREAIADWEQIVKMYQGGSSNARATSLNGVAYAQAVGSIDLDKALDNVEQALRLVPSEALLIKSYRDSVLFKSIRPQDATLTSFSAYEDYGIELFLRDYYYTLPKRELSIQEIFIHSLDSAGELQQKLFCVLFYLKNRDKLEGIDHPMMKDLKAVLQGEKIRDYPTLEDIEDRTDLYDIKL